MQSVNLQSLVRSLKDVPKEGIIFRDITTLLMNDEGFKQIIDQMVEPLKSRAIDKVVGIDSRGFILGGAIAYQLSVGFVPIRKKGKLPGRTIGMEYQLEYGSDCLQIHIDNLQQGQKVQLIDDLIATGGTALTAIQLLEKLEAEIVGCSFAIDLPDLGGTHQLRQCGIDVHTLMTFADD